MTDENMTRVSSKELLAKKAAGKLRINPDAPVGPSLGQEFWSRAYVEKPLVRRPVHLKLDAFVFQHFVDETGGKGHITRMQEVLKAYVRAMQAKEKVMSKD